jgi:hypothetical protein
MWGNNEEYSRLRARGYMTIYDSALNSASPESQGNADRSDVRVRLQELIEGLESAADDQRRARTPLRVRLNYISW